MKPYYADKLVTLYHADFSDVVRTIDAAVDCVIADPPYAQTSLAWDR